jgi:hypothetical protein
MTYLMVFLFIVIAFIFMAAMLYFSKYKQRESSCCTSSIEPTGIKEDSCLSCPNKDESLVEKQFEKIEKLTSNSYNNLS